MTNSDQLPSHLQFMLDFIRRYIHDNGYAPSVREICEAVGVPSTSTVHARLRQLEEAGALRRDPAKPRAMVVLNDSLKNDSSDNIPDGAFTPLTGQSEQPFLPPDYLSLPFIAFGHITSAFSGGESALGSDLKDSWLIPGKALKAAQYFITEMPDDSMINRQLYAGDRLIIRKQNTADNNDMIVGFLNGETLIRTYSKGLRQIRLQVEGDDFFVVTIDPEDLTIYGVIIGFIHLLE